MIFFKYTAINAVLFLIFDLIWFSFSGKFFLKQLEPIAKIADGSLSPRIAEAAVVYVMMSVGLEYFVFSQAETKSFLSLLASGALFGFLAFGIFDFTNRALLEHYPWPMVIVDVTWGTFLFTVTTACSLYIRKWI